MTTVYVVTSGSYSDYRINGVFLDKDKAEKFVERFNQHHSDYADIEEWEADSPDANAPGVWYVYMDKDGHIPHQYSPRYAWPSDTVGTYVNGFTAHKDKMFIIVPGHENEADRAVKVANEYRTIILAHDAWGDMNKVQAIFGGKDGNQ